MIRTKNERPTMSFIQELSGDRQITTTCALTAEGLVLSNAWI